MDPAQIGLVASRKIIADESFHLCIGQYLRRAKYHSIASYDTAHTQLYAFPIEQKKIIIIWFLGSLNVYPAHNIAKSSKLEPSFCRGS